MTASSKVAFVFVPYEGRLNWPKTLSAYQQHQLSTVVTDHRGRIDIIPFCMCEVPGSNPGPVTGYTDIFL